MLQQWVTVSLEIGKKATNNMEKLWIWIKHSPIVIKWVLYKLGIERNVGKRVAVFNPANKISAALAGTTPSATARASAGGTPPVRILWWINGRWHDTGLSSTEFHPKTMCFSSQSTTKVSTIVFNGFFFTRGATASARIYNVVGVQNYCFKCNPQDIEMKIYGSKCSLNEKYPFYYI